MKRLETDIVIIGAGSAGIAAAVAASRQGLKVALIEKNSKTGGKATMAEVGTVCGLYHTGKDIETRYAVNGFAREFAEKLSVLSGTSPISNRDGLHFLPYRIPAFSETCLYFLNKEKIDLYFETEVTGVNSESNHITSIECKSIGTELQIHTSSVVDCTGNALISHLLKAPLIIEDAYQAASQIFSIGPVKAVSPSALQLILLKSIREGMDQKFLDQGFAGISIVPGSFHNDNVNLKLVLPMEVTLKERNKENLRVLGIEMIQTFMNFVTTRVAAFKQSLLLNIAPEPGIRVEQRPVGNYILTETDVLLAKKQDNGIAIGTWPAEEWHTNGKVDLKFIRDNGFYHIPLACLESISYHNLYFGGRGISAEAGAIASARVMGICLQTGYAAGLLAACKLKGHGNEDTLGIIQKEQL